MQPALELRLFGELVKDAESWLSIGFMRTTENLDNDHYYQYKNAAGEIITSAHPTRWLQTVYKHDVGWFAGQPTGSLQLGYTWKII